MRRARWSHIDPGTGRNKRETGKLVKRNAQGGSKGNAIRKVAGVPAEKRITAARRRRTWR